MLAREIGDPRTLVRALSLQGSVGWPGDPSSAARPLGEALALAETVGFPEGIALIRSIFGSHAVNDGAYDDAVEHIRAALDGPLDSPQVRSMDLGNLAGALLLQDLPNRAVPHVLEALELARVHDLGGTVQTPVVVVAHLLSEREPATAAGLVAAVRRLLDQGSARVYLEASWEGPVLTEADAIARSLSDPNALGGALEAAAGWTWDEVVAVAVEGLETLDRAAASTEASGRAEPEDGEALA